MDRATVLGAAKAASAAGEAMRPKPAQSDPLFERFERRVSDPELRAAVRTRVESGHYADAVETAVKFLVTLVHTRSGCDPDADGTGLMTKVFSVGNPILRLNAGRTKSDLSEQLGYMHLYAGVVAAIRNPRAHRADVEDSPDAALMMLEWTNHLVFRARAARRVRKQVR